jgi:2-iminobutanoate/2-iminopropanoate deaminase
MNKFIKNDNGLPFSKAILYDSKYTLEVSGQVGLDSEGKLFETIEEQTKGTLETIKKILEEIGWSLENVVKVRVFLSDMKYYSVMNEIYSEYFSDDYPTRVALAVKELPLGAFIEIECTAAGDDI